MASQRGTTNGLQLRSLFLCGASLVALTAAGAVQAQTAPATSAAAAANSDVVVVTGIRGSLQKSMNLKRKADGVVDSINAEDIGKYPDTNLAESVQRIPGVSISRVNGQGEKVTVRGFGPQYNLVTLNGRTMPTASVEAVGGDASTDGVTGKDRSFDFSQIASDGINGFDVYKTGRASVASGGIGATLNVRTLRPLDLKAGSSGSIGVKGLYDGGVQDKGTTTGEISGVYNFVNDQKNFGVSIFGSHSESNIATREESVNGWNRDTGAQFLNPSNGRIHDTAKDGMTTQIQNAPAATDYVMFPNDNRTDYAETNYKRDNVSAVMQWRPAENLTFTLDGLYADTKESEARSDQSIWFNRPFDQVIFDGNKPNSTSVFLQENINGTKDMSFENQQRGVENKLTDIGFNAKWKASDDLTLNFDVHSAKSESLPGNSNGTTSTTAGAAAKVIAAHSLDFSTGYPVQAYTLNDAISGDNNGVLDIGDLGTQPARTFTASQTDKLDEARVDGTYAVDDQSHFDFGIGWRKSTLVEADSSTVDTLGDWGVTNPGDVLKYAPGIVHQYCLACLFKDIPAGQTQIAFRDNAIDLYNAMVAAYANPANSVALGMVDPTTHQPFVRTPQPQGSNFNQVEEQITSAYVQFAMKPQFLGHDAKLLAGLRLERTDVKVMATQILPTAIVWTANNDFLGQQGTAGSSLQQDSSYSNLLPSLDFEVNATDDMVARFSFSKTIARPSYGDMFLTTSVGGPGRPTYFGTNASGSQGNPDLKPLESDNFDVSWEWYYKKDSYVSVGYYTKNVTNFVGSGVVTKNLFGLRDPTSGAAGSRSGKAITALNGIGQGLTDDTLFTMVALIDKHNGDVAAATTEYQSLEGSNGQLTQANIDLINGQYDVTADANDPLFNFDVNTPVNNQAAKIHGWELQGQHFFGDTGFGVSASYTTVDGDIKFDEAASSDVNQFAVLGLSNTYNITAIYDKDAWSGRLAYNWRDKYLKGTNRDGANRNPTFVAPFGQLDATINYQLTPQIQITFEGLNLNHETYKEYARTTNEIYFAQELDTRYQLGVRYKF